MINEQDINNLLLSGDSKALAVQIVVFRLLGIRKEIAIKCMEELQRRRQNGDDFKFEEYIEKELKKSPSPSPKPTDDFLKTINSYIKIK